MTDADTTPAAATLVPPSELFPSISPDDYAGWIEQAAALSTPDLRCDADDVILAAHLLGFGEHILLTGEPATVRTAAMRRLFAGNPTSLRALIIVAQAIRKLQRDAVPPDPTQPLGEHLAVLGMQLTAALTTVLVTVAPDVKRPKHPKG
jgi:hypothetical protein